MPRVRPLARRAMHMPLADTPIETRVRAVNGYTPRVEGAQHAATTPLGSRQEPKWRW